MPSIGWPRKRWTGSLRVGAQCGRRLRAAIGLYRAIEDGASHIQRDTGRAVSEARLQLRVDLVLATLAVVKEVAEPEVSLRYERFSRSEGADPETDSLHHRKRGMRALQLLRDAEHSDRFPRLVAAPLPAGSRTRARRERRVSHLRHRRLLFPAAGRLAGRPFLWQIQYRLLAEPGLLRRSGVPGDVCHKPHRFLHRPWADRARLGRDQTVCGRIRRRPVRPDEQAPREGGLRCVSTGSSISARSSPRF